MIECGIMLGPASVLILVFALFTKDRVIRRGLFAAVRVLLVLFVFCFAVLKLGTD